MGGSQENMDILNPYLMKIEKIPDLTIQAI